MWPWLLRMHLGWVDNCSRTIILCILLLCSHHFLRISTLNRLDLFTFFRVKEGFLRILNYFSFHDYFSLKYRMVICWWLMQLWCCIITSIIFYWPFSLIILLDFFLLFLNWAYLWHCFLIQFGIIWLWAILIQLFI